ncbi:MAG: excinuclease ABC subunit UvrC [Eubacteriales bacterium]
MTELENKLKQLPDKSGVYLMKDAEGKIIYVGKAKVLKNRVKQYFTGVQKYVKVAAMVENIADLEYIICDTEMEALILECNLIKKYRPYYNILLKDDKHFPYVRIDLNEPYPRVTVVRKVKNDGAKYFGPYIAAHTIRDVLDSIYKIYPLRSCKKDIVRAIERKERPCLNLEMKRCIGPCTGLVSEAEYGQLVGEVIAMLGVRQNKLKAALRAEMQEASDSMNYERAAVLRDKLRLIKQISSKQKAGMPNLKDKDVFGVYNGENTAVAQSFLVRDGKLEHAEKYYFEYAGEEEGEILSAFLKQYYMDSLAIPKHIYISAELPDREPMEKWLSDKKGSHVEIILPVRGDNKKLAVLAQKNARDAVKLKEGLNAKKQRALKNLAQAIGLESDLSRIECYDISNTQGTDSVASMVVFEGGLPSRKLYRRFKIKTVEGSNDFASLQEAVTRRLLRGLDGDAGFIPLPDLIVVDGGKGQLSSVMDALASLGAEEIPLISLAKREEEIFVPGSSESILLKNMSPEFRLITSLRDEAHRFAITYHRHLRENRQRISELDIIPGVGDARKKALLKAFSGLDRIKKATLEELQASPGMTKPVAQNIYQHFHSDMTIDL